MIFGGLMVVAALIWPPVIAVETGASRHYPELLPQVVGAPPDEVARLLEQAIAQDHSLPYTLSAPAEALPQGTRLTLNSDRLIPLFDTTITVTATLDEGKTRVDMRASSLRGGGKTDFGMSARSIRELQQVLREHYVKD